MDIQKQKESLNSFLSSDSSTRFFNEKYFFNHYTELYNDFLTWNFPSSFSFTQKLFHYLNNDKELKLGFCCECENRCNFVNFKIGYRFYCCKKCADSSSIKQNKNKLTKLKKYGDPNFNNIEKSSQTKLERYGNENYNNREKYKETNLEKFGVDNPSQNEEVKEKIKETDLKRYGGFTFESEELTSKVKQTLNEKYGVDNFALSDEFKNRYTDEEFVKSIKHKSKLTCLKRYGTEFASQSDIIQEKRRKTFTEKLKKQYKEIIDCEDHKYICSCGDCSLCDNCETYEIEDYLFKQRKSIGVLNTCKKINKLNSSISNEEKNLLEYIQSLYKGEVIENDRSVLDGKELDIYIPEKKIAFEFNGVYWHSEFWKDKMYHQEKSIKCSQKGIQLIHIWEDDWLYKNDIVKDLVKSKLGLNENKIYARKCKIKEVDSKTSSEFLNKYHLQRNVNSKVKLGLFYNDELVEIITFGKLRKAMNSKSNDNEYELYRLCTKSGCSVIGGFSKLLAYFKKNYNPSKIITYASLDISNGNVYRNNEFKEMSLTSPGYFWVVDGIRKHRFNFTKQKLISEGFDSDKTEDQIMHERGYFKIFDSGNFKFELK